MSYSRTTWREGETALSAEHMNNIEDGVVEALTKAGGNSEMWEYIRDLVYPVGKIITTDDPLNTKEKVEAALGGTWVAYGQGRVLVGVGTSDRAFAVNETGGSSDAVLPSHTHTYIKSDNETGYHQLKTNEMPSHAHGLNGQYGTISYAPGAQTVTVLTTALSGGLTQYEGGNSPVHNHTISRTTDNTGSAGESGTGKNLMPYQTCYMWKRIA